MFEIPDAYFMSVILFFAVLAAVIYKDRKNIEFHTFLVMRRTKKFGELIDSIASISPGFWRAAATVGIVVGVAVMVYGIYILTSTAGQIAVGAITQPAMQFVLPSPSSTGSSGPGYILIPFWFWIITIGSILVPHEMMHGIISRAEKIRLKSVGLLLMVIFPGAFVEPEEKQLQRAKLLTRLRIFAAGSFANFSIAVIILALMAFAVWPAVAGTGMVLDSVTAGSPAALAGLSVGQTLASANGVALTSTYWEYMSGRGYFADEVGTVSVGDELSLVAGGKTYAVKAVANPETGAPYIGVTYKPVMKLPTTEFFTIAQLFTMIWLFSFAVGMVNILPIFPLDGGLMFEAVMKKYVKGRNAQLLTRGVTYFLVAVLLFDFVGPWMLGLF